MLRVTRKESPSEHWDNHACIRVVKIVIARNGKNFSIKNFSGLHIISRFSMEMVSLASNSAFRY